MEKLIFRIDDVSENTDFVKYAEIVKLIKRFFDAEIISGVSVGCYSLNQTGQVYDNKFPFKHHNTSWFYNINKLWDVTRNGLIEGISSHGLLHIDHSQMSREAQEMSIVTSCRLLGTKRFIPPFGRHNEDTVIICDEFGFELVTSSGWKSIDFNFFEESHKKWYFHLWKFTMEGLWQRLKPGIVLHQP